MTRPGSRWVPLSICWFSDSEGCFLFSVCIRVSSFFFHMYDRYSISVPTHAKRGGEGEFSKRARARKKEQHNCYIKCDDKQHYAEMRPGVLKSAKLWMSRSLAVELALKPIVTWLCVLTCRTARSPNRSPLNFHLLTLTSARLMLTKNEPAR